MNLSLLFTILVAGLLQIFANNPEHSIQKPTIVGSWELVKYVNHAGNETDWQSYESKILYQKHITDNYFMWIKFDQENDQLLGMGGGDYTIDDKGQYVENIKFFYPPTSSELGQSIPFDITFKEGLWHHTGYAKVMTMNEEGRSEVTDSVKIQEQWKSISASFNDRGLIGAWELQTYKDENNEEFLEYPDFIVYRKLITDSHFVWIKYNADGDEIFDAGSGPYSYDGKEYVENIVFTYPKGVAARGSKAYFTPDLNEQKWIHKGTVEISDSSKIAIDEVWEPM
ncbi:MAG: hypothetical protein ACI8QD_001399 [Cyclobacteriaceae bacterium]|jgi:hypothetical protein